MELGGSPSSAKLGVVGIPPFPFQAPREIQPGTLVGESTAGSYFGVRAAGALLALAAMSVVAALPACRPASTAVSPPRVPSAIRYEARVTGGSPWLVDVEATFTGGAGALMSDAPGGLVSLTVTDGSGDRSIDVDESSPGSPRSFALGCEDTCRVRYRYDLSRAAKLSDDPIDEAVARGPDMLAPAYAWLLRPEALAAAAPVKLVVEATPGVKVASPFRRAEGEAGPNRHVFDLEAQDLVNAGFMAFGSFTSLRIDVTGGIIDVSILRGDRRADDATLRRWVATTAKMLDPVFGRFPLARTELFIVPTPFSSEVETGRTLAAAGGSVAVVMGEGAGEEDLRGDWILTHELFHLGVPSFLREGRWLDEGLATYYEPVLRTRAGIRSDVQLWTEFANGMPRGLAYEGELSLLHTNRHERLYWGGATFALEADVLIRSRTGGARSLDDGLRAALAKGANATEVWSLPAYLDAIDEGTGLRVMRELYEATAKRGWLDACDDARHASDVSPDGGGLREWRASVRAKGGAKTDGVALGFTPATGCALSDRDVLQGLLHALGVTRSASGRVHLIDEAPLSPIRRTLARRAGGQ